MVASASVIPSRRSLLVEMPSDPELELPILRKAMHSSVILPDVEDFTVSEFRAVAAAMLALPPSRRDSPAARQSAARGAIEHFELAILKPTAVLPDADYLRGLGILRRLAMRRQAIGVGLAIAEMAAEDGRPLQCAAMASELSHYLITEGLEAVSWQDQ